MRPFDVMKLRKIPSGAASSWDFLSIGSEGFSSSGDFSPGLPAGTASGDLLVACIAYRDSAAFAVPAGWTLVAQESLGNTATTDGIASGLVAYIVRGAGSPSVLFTRTAGNVAIGVIVAYRGNHATPFDTHSARTLAVSSTTLTAASLTTANAGELIVALGAVGDSSAAGTFDAATDPSTASGAVDTVTEPTNGTWIQRHSSSTTSGSDVGIGVADAVRATAGSTGDFSATTGLTGRHVFIAAAFKLA